MSFLNLMQYEIKILEEVLHDDGLLILAEGLGLDRLLLNLLHGFCNPKCLVLVLNTNEEEQDFIINELSAVNVETIPKKLTAEISTDDRRELYFKGGVVFVTSRILVVDLLMKRVPAEYVSGIVVNKAHKLADTSQESFILRLFREDNSDGFIKGLSDSPISFMSNYNKVERVMKQLFVKKLYIYPRFHSDVIKHMDVNKPEVIELNVELTLPMKTIQFSLFHLIETSLRELRRMVPSLDPEEINLENSLTVGFDKNLKQELDPYLNELPKKVKQLITDIKNLRTILTYLTQYDCITFYNFLNSLRSCAKDGNGEKYLWMLLDHADSLFISARARVYGSKPPSSDIGAPFPYNDIEVCPKWNALKEVLDEIDSQKEHEGEGSPATPVLICTSDERTALQLRQLISDGPKELLKGLFEKSPSFSKVKQKSSKTKEAKAPINNQEDISVDILEEDHIIIHSIFGSSDPYCLLHKLYDFKPEYVLLYDVSLRVLRQLEVYKASVKDLNLKIYFIMFSGSAEEQKYLTMLRKEKHAFEVLIRQKSEMVVPEEREARTEIGRKLIRDLVKENVNSRKRGGQIMTENNRKVIVDMREFRCELPSLLHRRGLNIEPVTLEVGDYILTPQICVERKSISDLIGSLNNGRLYTQCVAMTRFYERPVLLIEFDMSKSFSLQAKKDLKDDVSLKDISSKLTLLTIHFPKLRIVWSQGPNVTAEIFEDLKENKDEPSAEKAMCVGMDQADSSNDLLFNVESVDLVKALPGITLKNYRKIVNKYKDFNDLVFATQEKLSSDLESKSLGKEIYEFINKKYQPEVIPVTKKKRK